MAEEPVKSLKVFYCYAREDQLLRDQLEKHLFPLKHSGQITDWHDREILPGTVWKTEIDTHLNTANIILLLISADFIASKYCYGREMQQALIRCREGKCHIIPIILRPVFLKDTPISDLQLLPSDGNAITSWSNQDAAFKNVTAGIYDVIEQIRKPREEQQKNLKVEQKGNVILFYDYPPDPRSH